jgi:hypothetical protein
MFLPRRSRAAGQKHRPAAFNPEYIETQGEDMQPDCLSFFQDRIAAAYKEQVWAVALVGGMNAFIASHAGRVAAALKRWHLQAIVATVSVLALGFVWSRHFIFMHYDDCVKGMLASTACGALCSPDPIYGFAARWSGITLYTFIITGLYLFASRTIAKSDPANGDTPFKSGGRKKPRR